MQWYCVLDEMLCQFFFAKISCCWSQVTLCQATLHVSIGALDLAEGQVLPSHVGSTLVQAMPFGAI